MHITFGKSSFENKNRYMVSVPSYTTEIRQWYDYILCKPIGTDCLVVGVPPNTFKFYHITADVVCDKIPFICVSIPKVCLSESVLLYATMIRQKVCTVHDITYVSHYTLTETRRSRLKMLREWFTHNPEIYYNTVMVFGISHMVDINSSTDIEYELSKVVYPIRHIEYMAYEDVCSEQLVQHITLGKDIRRPKIVRMVDISTSYMFSTMADILPDIYHLYDDSDIYVGVAHIPDYRTSVYMNSIFRTIKENANLDLLEESDDEAEFENTSISKYVNLKKMERIECVYNVKFMKWTPLRR